MKIVVLDGYTLNPGDLSWQCFEELGEFICYDRTGPTDILSRVEDAEIVLTNKTPLTSKTISSCSKLKYIGVLATGYNVVDVETAGRKGIPVCNIPTYGTAAVAQFVFALLLNICHHVQDHSNAVFKGEWGKSPDFCFWNFPLTELSGKTMGIIGYGRIGQAAGEIARAFGMNILAFDEYQNPDLINDTMKYASIEELLSKSDVISLHCPLLEETEGIINKNSIAKMKSDAIIINTSRGQLFVEEDLAEALNNGKLRAAGLDVVSTEPIECNNPLLKAKNCFITPHIAWAPIESRTRLMNIAVDNLRSFLDGKTVNKVD